MKIKRILHLGDIHFFKNKRFEEYRFLTNILCKHIVNYNIELVYLGGDIVDSKDKLSPNQIAEVSNFFNSITQLVPIVMIPGNHDTNLKNSDTLDSLTPIIDNLVTKNPIYYLTATGIYHLFDIDWAVWSCIDDLDPFKIGSPSTSEKQYTIGCYHGPIKGCTTDSGFSSFPNSPTVDIFKSCNSVFLNDIHKRQYFRNNEIAYSGSWVQVKIDEEEQKGALLWEWNDLEEKYISSFVEIENPYGFKTIQVNDLLSFDPNQIKVKSNKTTIRLLYSGNEDDFSAVKFNEIKKQVCSSLENPIITQKLFKKKKNFLSKKHLTKGATQDFFQIYLDSEGVSKIHQPLIKDIDTHYTKQVDSTDYQTGEYYIHEVEVHNFLCFGENNIVNFSDMQGLIGLFADNGFGKTTLFNAVVFCLFNKTNKNSSAIKLINDQLQGKEKAFVQVQLFINGVLWRIKRTIIPSSFEKASIKVEVYETVDGIEIARHDESRPKTDSNVLKKLLGDEETFLTTVFWEQRNSTEFVDAKNADRLDKMIKFLGISMYDQKYELVHDDIAKEESEYKKLKEDLDKLKTKEELLVDQIALETLNSESVLKITEIQTNIDVLNKKIQSVQNKITKLNLVGISGSLEEAEALLETNCVLYEKKLKELTESKTSQKDLIDKWNADPNLKGKLMIWERTPEATKDLEEELFNTNLTIKNLKAQLNSETCPTCNQKWHKVDRIQVEKDIDSFKKKSVQLSEQIDLYQEEQKVIYKKQQAINGYDGQIKLLESQVETIEGRITSARQQIHVFKDNEEKILLKKGYDSNLKNMSKELDLLKASKVELETTSKFQVQQIKKLTEQIDLYEKKYGELEQKEEAMKWLTFYKKAMHRTGVPSLILEAYIPLINNEINEYLADLFEFKVEFELKDNYLDVYFIYDALKNKGRGRRDIVQACGMEGIVINLAIRAALTKISLLPKPSLLMLDEVFAQLDDKHREQMKLLLVNLKNQYYNIILISHIDDMKDLPEHLIKLNQINGVTSIES